MVNNSISNNLTENNSTSTRQHYLWGDITKGIAITLVVAGHSYFPKNFSDFIYLFHMPLFFILAGYFFDFSKYCDNFKLLLLTSAKRLLLPALLWKLVFFNITSRKFLDNLLIILYASGRNVLKFKTSIGSAWFLPCLFLVRIFLWTFLKLTKKFESNDFVNCIIAFFITSSGILIGKYIKLPWSFDIALSVLYITYIGYLLNKYNFFKKKFLLLFTYAGALILGYIDYKYFGLDLNSRIYTNPFISLNTAIGLSIIVIRFSMLLEKINITYLNLLLKYLGLNSLIILLSHHLAYSEKFTICQTIFTKVLMVIPDYSYKFGICLTIWRFAASIAIIELLALFPATKKIFSAVSIVSIFKEHKQNQTI